MNPFPYDRVQIASVAQFSKQDLQVIQLRRQAHNQLGFGYQLAFVRLLNRFPTQEPFEVINEIVIFTSLQLHIDDGYVHFYGQRRKTVSEHQELIRQYLNLRLFSTAITDTETFIYQQAFSSEQTSALMARIREYLKNQYILEPALDTLKRMIQTQREAARFEIYNRIHQMLPVPTGQQLEQLLKTGKNTYSELHTLKQPPGLPSPVGFHKLDAKLKVIQATGILNLDMSWLNNNFQRSLARYARQCTLSRLRRLREERRHAVLVCFLFQLHQDTFDAMVQMYDKLMNKIHNRAERDVDDYLKKRRRQIRSSLSHYQKVLTVLLDDAVPPETILPTIYEQVDLLSLKQDYAEIQILSNSKHQHTFDRVIARHSYLRQFSPALLNQLQFQIEAGNPVADSLMDAVQILHQMNTARRHKLPDDAPISFIPKKWRSQILGDEGQINKPAWECALLTLVRDQIKSGNLSVQHSKRYATLDTFFMPESQWVQQREAFFARAGLPSDPEKVVPYLTQRLNQAYDQFLENLPKNHYARIDNEAWKITTDPNEKLDKGTDERLKPLKDWLGQHIRTIKLPDLLIDVDNDLRFTRHFIATTDTHKPDSQQVCETLAAIMAHASEIGTYTMAQIIEGISYHRLKQISDWQLHEDNQHSALAVIVNAISQLDISQAWGDGTTSSSDGQRFALRRKVLSQSYSQTFNDFAIEFYSFVADNYAPFFSLPHECSDRDAPFVLDGLLYNESDLEIEEHYTDTHGFTDINFAAFTLLGKRFIPRIKALHKYAIFRIDSEQDYGALTSLVDKKDRTLNLDWIVEEWNRMGHFYASLENGHVTASTALRRLNGFTGKNHFYRANRELGRILRTEHTLSFMSDPALRQRNRRGLLKGEQIHALARDIKMGKRGRVNTRDYLEQRHSCSCLTLVMSCIIYWQAKEINRVLQEHTPDDSIDFSMIKHISPIAWENIILYGDYILNREKVKV
ncbi:MAG: Tn3 family transposase [Candidatus Poribacteria bacterium]|jgi:TnpA family transposase|nr:Tn3 family transposase [Candidatus Poribacteria bacterium]